MLCQKQKQKRNSGFYQPLCAAVMQNRMIFKYNRKGSINTVHVQFNNPVQILAQEFKMISEGQKSIS